MSDLEMWERLRLCLFMERFSMAELSLLSHLVLDHDDHAVLVTCRRVSMLDGQILANWFARPWGRKAILQTMWKVYKVKEQEAMRQ